MGQIVFVLVVIARIGVPLGTPRFPLPAILLSLVIDAADQTILAAFDAEPDNYQQYDKALDIYYLAIAYISTLRNWPSGVAFRVSQFLWYYRLIGVVAFELTLSRSVLLIFPNTFEFFFIFYEVIRLRWAPGRLPTRTVLGAAAGIWIFIKLPQEWWIHVAQLDFTEVVSDNPILWPIFAALAALAWLWLRRELKELPMVDWPTTFAVDAHSTTVFHKQAAAPWGPWALINHPLFEKTILVGLITTIFLQLAPNPNTGVVQITIGVGVIIVSSSFVGHWLCRRGSSWTTTTADLVATGTINVAVVLLLRLVPADSNPWFLLTLFLLGLLTLIVTLYDRYRGFRLDSVTDLTLPRIRMPGSTKA